MRIIIISLFVVLSHSTSAQFVEFGLGLGVSQYSGDLEYGYKFSSVRPAVNVHYRLNFSEALSTRFNLMYGGLAADDSTPVDILGENRDLSFQSSVVELSSVFEYHFLDYKNHDLPQKWSPYAFVGFGIMRLNNPANTEVEFAKNQPVIPMGVGFKHKLGKQFVIEMEAGARKTFYDYLDGVSDGDITLKNTSLVTPMMTIGISLQGFDYHLFYTTFHVHFLMFQISPCLSVKTR